jgi:hypothetical protein
MLSLEQNPLEQKKGWLAIWALQNAVLVHRTSFTLQNLQGSTDQAHPRVFSPVCFLFFIVAVCSDVCCLGAMAQQAGEGADWKNKLNLPPKDTRIRTEVGFQQRLLGSELLNMRPG